jgi:hypothetical protein
MIHLLQLCPMAGNLERDLARRFTVHRYFNEENPEAFLAEHARSIRAADFAKPLSHDGSFAMMPPRGAPVSVLTQGTRLRMPLLTKAVIGPQSTAPRRVKKSRRCGSQMGINVMRSERA